MDMVLKSNALGPALRLARDRDLGQAAAAARRKPEEYGMRPYSLHRR
jgi:hypothetical protein